MSSCIDLTIFAGDQAVKAFKALKRFDASLIMGPNMALLRADQPLHIETHHPNRLELFSRLLSLLDELGELQIRYEISLTEGPPKIVEGKPIWTAREGSRADIVAIVETEEKINEDRLAAEAHAKSYQPPEPPDALKLLRRRWDEVDFEDLLPSEQNYIYLWSLSVEVENGGFDTYFFNSAGDQAKYAQTALRELGSVDVLDTLSDAIAMLDNVGGFSEDRDDRWKLLNQLSDDAFVDLNARFYERTENVLAMALEAVEKEYDSRNLSLGE